MFVAGDVVDVVVMSVVGEDVGEEELLVEDEDELLVVSVDDEDEELEELELEDDEDDEDDDEDEEDVVDVEVVEDDDEDVVDVVDADEDEDEDEVEELEDPRVLYIFSLLEPPHNSAEFPLQGLMHPVSIGALPAFTVLPQ